MKCACVRQLYFWCDLVKQIVTHIQYHKPVVIVYQYAPFNGCAKYTLPASTLHWIPLQSQDQNYAISTWRPIEHLWGKSEKSKNPFFKGAKVKILVMTFDLNIVKITLSTCQLKENLMRFKMVLVSSFIDKNTKSYDRQCSNGSPKKMTKNRVLADYNTKAIPSMRSKIIVD